MTAKFFFLLALSLFGLLLNSQMANAQAAAWPATSYSPYFQNLFAQASAPVAALPSGPGAMAPAIPVGAGAPAFGPAFGPPGR
ncbi:hypothetical protein M3Y99_00273200 [Aphelenchoides fujianensis]|nr:hypothetical protein M3Y99_01673900 [Aphelenchoides fujianensis]KAI6241972.1 hypothetical protein M3Y99_00273200 [Aphelenchoides fujianensis]